MIAILAQGLVSQNLFSLAPWVSSRDGNLVWIVLDWRFWRFWSLPWSSFWLSLVLEPWLVDWIFLYLDYGGFGGVRSIQRFGDGWGKSN